VTLRDAGERRRAHGEVLSLAPLINGDRVANPLKTLTQ
jgi:hypothetical protein